VHVELYLRAMALQLAVSNCLFVQCVVVSALGRTVILLGEHKSKISDVQLFIIEMNTLESVVSTFKLIPAYLN